MGTDGGVILADETVKLSKAAQKEAQKVAAQKIRSSRISGTSHYEEVAMHLGIDDTEGASLVLAIEMGPSRYGVLGLAAWGKIPTRVCISSLWKSSMSPSPARSTHPVPARNRQPTKRLIRENEEIRKRLMGQRVIGAAAASRRSCPSRAGGTHGCPRTSHGRDWGGQGGGC